MSTPVANSAANRPALSRWEQQSAGYRSPLADADNIRDPGYIYARIQHALQRAKESAPASPLDPDVAELIALKVWLEDLTDDLRLYTTAADELLETLRAVAPELHWYRSRALFAHAWDEQTALECATRLRLRDAGHASTGERRWRGVHEGLPVTVYGPVPKSS